MKTPIRYAGGKNKAYKVITGSMPGFPHPKRIVSPFMGGGSLESRWSSELGISVKAFDIFKPLVNFWNVLLEDSNALADKLETLEPNREVYAEVKEKILSWEVTQEMLKDWSTDHYKRDSITLSNLDAAAYYYHNHQLSYGPMFLGWFSKIYDDKTKWERNVNRIREYKNTNLSVENKSFEDAFDMYPNDFFYLDPPYYLKKDSDNKMFKGIYPNPNIDVHHTGFNHELLRDLLHNHKGSFMLSYNNCETIREYYKDFELRYPSWSYSFGNGETRIGKNKQEVGNTPKESHEILIIKS